MASSPLIYYQIFTPEELNTKAEWHTSDRNVSTTQLRIGPDHDGQGENLFKLKLLDQLPTNDVTFVVRIGSAIIPSKRDPLYVMISDNDFAIGFKISESGPIKGAEGDAGRYLTDINLRGDTI